MNNEIRRRDREASTDRRRRSSGARGPPFAPDDFLVVAIGASAGGLEACRKFVTALPPQCGMAFVLVQHLDPTHPSMMVELLDSHTTMVVQQATEGMRIEPDHLYVIPPAKQLSVEGGTLRVSQPDRPHGTRMPFDVLLQSMAGAFGNRAVAIVLSGTGSDGSTALHSVKSQLGLVIAQAPNEAGSDGMSRSAIEAGVVDLVLPVAKIPDALLAFDGQRARGDPSGGMVAVSAVASRLPEIIALLRERTSHDFTLNKSGTLQRRIERRMALVAVARGDVDGYIGLLHSDAGEPERLANDLLINVTRFFRDPEIFDVLAKTIIPDLVARRDADRKLRIWIAGCSTGEEAYSLVILILEHIANVGGGINLQVFASDADLDAVAFAREGQYPDSVAADITPERLARFFSKEKQGYRVLPELRSAIIFTCQDVLIDPPFSHLDFISCRNLLIYLGAAAQTRVIDLFHFALREGGVLLLGNTESIGATDNRFEVLSEAGRIYRHVGRCRPGEVRFTMGSDDGARGQRVAFQEKPRLRPTELAELCRRMVIDNFAPAAMLINRRHDCIYSVGPTERFLRVAPGHPTHDLLDMVPQPMRTRLRAVIARAREANARAHATGFRVNLTGGETEFDVDVIPVPNDAEHQVLVCFIESTTKQDHKAAAGPGMSVPSDSPRDAALEIELEATRSELRQLRLRVARAHRSGLPRPAQTTGKAGRRRLRRDTSIGAGLSCAQLSCCLSGSHMRGNIAAAPGEVPVVAGVRQGTRSGRESGGAANDADQNQQADSAQCGRYDLSDQVRAGIQAQPRQQRASQDCADNADDNVADDTEAVAFDDDTGQEAGDGADEQPDEQCFSRHFRSPQIWVPMDWL